MTAFDLPKDVYECIYFCDIPKIHVASQGTPKSKILLKIGTKLKVLHFMISNLLQSYDNQTSVVFAQRHIDE